MAELLRPFCGGDGGIWFNDDRFAEIVLGSRSGADPKVLPSLKRKGLHFHCTAPLNF